MVKLVAVGSCVTAEASSNTPKVILIDLIRAPLVPGLFAVGLDFTLCNSTSATVGMRSFSKNRRFSAGVCLCWKVLEKMRCRASLGMLNSRPAYRVSYCLHQSLQLLLIHFWFRWQNFPRHLMDMCQQAMIFLQPAAYFLMAGCAAKAGDKSEFCTPCDPVIIITVLSIT